MSWIAEVHESAAEGRLKECYERVTRALGRMIPFYRAFTPSPRLLSAHLEFYGALGGPGVLSKLRREYIATAVSAERTAARTAPSFTAASSARSAPTRRWSTGSPPIPLELSCRPRTGRSWTTRSS